MPIYSDNSQSIGKTPLVKLNRVTAGCGATVLAKIDSVQATPPHVVDDVRLTGPQRRR